MGFGRRRLLRGGAGDGDGGGGAVAAPLGWGHAAAAAATWLHHMHCSWYIQLCLHIIHLHTAKGRVRGSADGFRMLVGFPFFIKKKNSIMY